MLSNVMPVLWIKVMESTDIKCRQQKSQDLGLECCLMNSVCSVGKGGGCKVMRRISRKERTLLHLAFFLFVCFFGGLGESHLVVLRGCSLWAQGTIWGALDWTQVGRMQSKHFTCSNPIHVFSCLCLLCPAHPALLSYSCLMVLRGPHGVPGIELRLLTCARQSTLPIILFHWLFLFLFLSTPIHFREIKE